MNARRMLLPSLALVAALPGIALAQAAGAKAKPAAAPKPAAKAAATAAPTTARQVIDRYVDAIGGRAAIAARKSSRATLTMEVPAAGMKADMVVSAMAPNKMLVKTTLPGLGEIMQGYDGETAWAIDPMQGARVLSGKELDQARAQADFDAELRPDSLFSTMELVEKTEFEGRPAYKLRLVRKTGEEVREFYDVENGLLLGSQTTVETQMGAIEATMIRSDYKRMGGLLQATRNVQRAGGQEYIITLVSAEDGVVDPAVFALPEQVKALLPAK